MRASVAIQILTKISWYRGKIEQIKNLTVKSRTKLKKRRASLRLFFEILIMKNFINRVAHPQEGGQKKKTP